MVLNLETTDDLKALSFKNKNLIFLSDEQIRQVQQIELETVRDIIAVCNDLDTNYHFTGGSALGVVRHQGFIPWDDDVDIDIARKDLAPFLQEFSHRFGYKYWIHGPHSPDAHCARCYQIRRKGTTFRSNADPISEECGIAVDLPVMENTFDNAALRRVHGFISLLLGLIVSCRRFYMSRDYLLSVASDVPVIQKKFQTKVRLGWVFSFASLHFWTELYDRWNSICHNENSIYVTVPTGRKHFFGELYRRSDFAETTTGMFEGLEVKIPKAWDSYLRHMYGDYMTFPPKDKQERHLLVEFSIDL